MLQCFQGQTRKVPVRLRASDGTAKTNALFTQVTVKISKDGGAFVTKTMADADWINLGNGYYALRLSATDTDTPGLLMYTVDFSGADQYPGAVDIHPAWAQTTDVTTAQTTLTAKIDAIPTVDLSGVATATQLTSAKDAITAKIDAIPPVDLTSVLSKLTGIDTKIDTTAAKVDTVSAKTTAMSTQVSAMSTQVATLDLAPVLAKLNSALIVLSRLQGLNYDNAVTRERKYDNKGRLLSAVIRQYDSDVTAQADDGVTGLVRTFQILTTYDPNGRVASFRITCAADNSVVDDTGELVVDDNGSLVIF